MALGGLARRDLAASRSSCVRQLPRATRGSRERQLQSLVSEFCVLSFDLVDPSEQAALTRRMLAFLLYLEHSLPYWDGAATRQPRRLEEKAYRLLGISDEDMWAIERLSHGAGEHMEARRYRAAYEELCTARWRLATAPREAAAPEAELQAPEEQEAPRHFERIVQALLHGVCSKESLVPVPELSYAPDFAEASTTDELSDEDTGAEQPHVFIFEERASKLESNDTRLVKRKSLALGDFAFILLPRRLSQKRHCSGFRAARGLCHMQVKKCGGAAADIELRILLRGGERPIIVRHDFGRSSTCEVQEVVDLRKLVNAGRETFSVHFSLISHAS